MLSQPRQSLLQQLQCGQTADNTQQLFARILGAVCDPRLRDASDRPWCWPCQVQRRYRPVHTFPPTPRAVHGAVKTASCCRSLSAAVRCESGKSTVRLLLRYPRSACVWSTARDRIPRNGPRRRIDHGAPDGSRSTWCSRNGCRSRLPL